MGGYVSDRRLRSGIVLAVTVVLAVSFAPGAARAREGGGPARSKVPVAPAGPGPGHVSPPARALPYHGLRKGEGAPGEPPPLRDPAPAARDPAGAPGGRPHGARTRLSRAR